MKRKLLISLLVGGLCFGMLQIIPTFAAENSDQQAVKGTSISKNDLRGERRFDLNNELLISIAKKYGVSLEGKNIATIQKELGRAAILVKAKELGISTAGKSIEQVEAELKALYEEQINPKENKRININDLRLGSRKDILSAKAKEYGVQMEGKEMEAVQQELLMKLINEKAKELGISTEGKDLDTLMKEIKDAYEKDR